MRVKSRLPHCTGFEYDPSILVETIRMKTASVFLNRVAYLQYNILITFGLLSKEGKTGVDLG